MHETRVLLFGISPMLASLVTEIVEDEDGIVIVGTEQDDADIGEAVSSAAADVVITRSGETSEAGVNPFSDILYRHSRLKVVTVGVSASVHTLAPTQIRLGELFPKALVDAIRSARVDGLH